MATHHSKTGRAKSSHDKIVVPSWDEVWDSFKEENTKTTIEAMNAEGWKTLKQVSEEVGLSRVHLGQMAESGKFDKTTRKVLHCGLTREMIFVRPKL